jgi:hypothetical protein
VAKDVADAGQEQEASPEEKVEEAERRDMLLQCRTKDEAFDLIKDVGAGTYGLVSKCDALPFLPHELIVQTASSLLPSFRLMDVHNHFLRTCPHHLPHPHILPTSWSQQPCCFDLAHRW